MKPTRLYGFFSLLLLFSPFLYLFGNSQGVPAAKTGAPGEGSCTECHTSPANTRGGSVSMQFTTPGSYSRGIPQLLTLRVNPGTGGTAIGFQITAKFANGQQAGQFTTFSFSNASVQTTNNIQYLSHAQTSTATTYYLQWIAPDYDGPIPINLYVAAVAGVPDGAATAADAVYTANYTLLPDTRLAPDGYRWEFVNIPGSSGMQFLSLANDGRVLGRYSLNGVTQSFVRNPNGTITTVSGSPTRINSSGTMIEGNRVIASDGTSRTITIAGAGTVSLLDLNDAGFVLGRAGTSTFLQTPSGETHIIDPAYVPTTLNGMTNAASFYGTIRLPGTMLPGGDLRTVSGYSRTLGGCYYVYTNSYSMAGVNDFGDFVSTCNATVVHTPQVLTSLTMSSNHGFVFGNHAGFSPPWGLSAETGVNNALQVIGVDDYESHRPVLLTPCAASPGITAVTVSGDGATFTVPMSGADGCRPSVILPYWLTAMQPDIAAGVMRFTATSNIATTSRTGTIVFNRGTVTVTQAGASCPNFPSPTYASVPVAGGQLTVNVSTNAGCQWSAVSNASWATITSAPVNGSGSFTINFAPNNTSNWRTVTVAIGLNSFSASQDNNQVASNYSGMRFVPVTPCRVMDTRPEGGKSGVYGPPRIAIQTSRDVPIPQSGCGIPAYATAFALNLTVVPRGYLGFITLWPSGEQRPLASTLNSWDGRVTANAAIIGAGVGGAVSVYASNDTDVVMDINGYFVPTTSGLEALAFYPVTPCRAADTRVGEGKSGPFGPPLLSTQTFRTFPMPSAGCGVPTTARAYSLNVTAVPRGYLGFVTIYPSTQSRPLASTLNSWDGTITANAAIVPAGSDGAVNVYASNDTDIIVDVNGYFAAATNPGSTNYYPQTPCRMVDTRVGGGVTGAFGPPSLSGNSEREFPFSDTSSTGCYLSSIATAAVLNVTVVPPGPLSYLTIWPSGLPRPLVSTLNAVTGQVTANTAIVPTGINRALRVYVFNPSDVVIDAYGYFAP